ncbi:hypothetical protein CHS0354_000476 [Potamilus streckersoni]|uniref:DNA methylase N-4/N-6 domain-containing protein n=1 Tax=Potamilus streckersoni TaxID=2493646 RepID=A0AAE0W8B4_9BIVA|nr:hypothetical protein CHS0354_000476 [Potamilus streckersoni]
MNYWIQLSIEYANQRSYLDDLFHVYPTIPEGIRELNSDRWSNVEKSFKKKDNDTLIKELFKFNLFPIKDSYIAYLKRDTSSIERNPKTINRICGRLYEMGLDKIFERCSEPKETNRQIGPFFRRWINTKALGILPVSLDEFMKNKEDAILNGSDKQLMDFASSKLNYKHPKGLDFIGRFNGKYVIGEAKFLTDFGGHQNAQFNDAISTVKAKNVKAIKVAILDGVLYIKGKSKIASTISGCINGIVAYKDTLKGDDFIEFLRERLVLLNMLLSDIGSIYLHIDYKIGHYVKIVMDEIFGIENFRNDITRVKCNPKNFERKAYGNIKDMILFYSKSDNMIWHEPKTTYTQADKIKLFPKRDKEGRHYTTIPLHAPGETKNGKTSQAFKGILPPSGRHWRSDVKVLEQLDNEGLIEWSDNGNPRKIIYFDEQEGKRMQDIWELKDPQYPVYPTEKNFDLLNIIVKTSSNENSIVLDCFCGSGTTLKAAQINGRHWIGIDQSDEAIKATTTKMNGIKGDLFISQTDFQFWTDKEIKL